MNLFICGIHFLCEKNVVRSLGVGCGGGHTYRF